MLTGLVHLTEIEDDCEQKKRKRDLCYRSASVSLPNRFTCIMWTKVLLVFQSFFIFVGSFCLFAQFFQRLVDHGSFLREILVAFFVTTCPSAKAR